MTDDLRQQLDAAITEARGALYEYMIGAMLAKEYEPPILGANFDRYAALVECRGRWDALRSLDHYTRQYRGVIAAMNEIEADVRRLLGETP